jgi:23S rRNA-/tRNA-specific pseudouridylate synthase
MPDPKAIEILIDDPWFLVVNKPIDLLTQAIDTLPSLQSRLIEQAAALALPLLCGPGLKVGEQRAGTDRTRPELPEHS